MWYRQYAKENLRREVCGTGTTWRSGWIEIGRRVKLKTAVSHTKRKEKTRKSRKKLKNGTVARFLFLKFECFYRNLPLSYLNLSTKVSKLYTSSLECALFEWALSKDGELNIDVNTSPLPHVGSKCISTAPSSGWIRSCSKWERPIFRVQACRKITWTPNSSKNAEFKFTVYAAPHASALHLRLKFVFLHFSQLSTYSRCEITA